MEVTKKSEIPNSWMVYVMESPTRIDDLGGTDLWETLLVIKSPPLSFLMRSPKNDGLVNQPIYPQAHLQDPQGM